jgi:hypothetical protein
MSGSLRTLVAPLVACVVAASPMAHAHEAGIDTPAARSHPAFLAGHPADADDGPVVFGFVTPTLTEVVDEWAQTLLGRGLAAVLRLYAPLQPWLDDIRSH